MKKIILIVFCLIIIFYIIFRYNVINQIDQFSNSFFSDYISTNKEHIEKYFLPKDIYLINILGRHKDSINNYNYKRLKPSINIVLNKANIEVSWNLTLEFTKHDRTWYISKISEY